jgi:hypothetical protein
MIVAASEILNADETRFRAVRARAILPVEGESTMSDPDITLHGLRLSGHSHRAELFLSRLNPLGQVPVLTDGEVVVPDSHAILVGLAARDAPGSGGMLASPIPQE